MGSNMVGVRGYIYSYSLGKQWQGECSRQKKSHLQREWVVQSKAFVKCIKIDFPLEPWDTEQRWRKSWVRSDVGSKKQFDSQVQGGLWKARTGQKVKVFNRGQTRWVWATVCRIMEQIFCPSLCAGAQSWACRKVAGVKATALME